MCLSYLKKYKPCEKGYKIMSRYHGTLGGEVFSVGRERPVGKWLNEKSYREILCVDYDTIRVSHEISRYPCGWHILHFKTDALRLLKKKDRGGHWVIVEVEVRKPVATGYQKHFFSEKPMKITVAKDIKITSVLDV